MKEEIKTKLIVLIVCAMIVCSLIGILIGQTMIYDKIDKSSKEIYPHIYDKPDTIQIIIDDRGWEVTHPYKRMRGN